MLRRAKKRQQGSTKDNVHIEHCPNKKSIPLGSKADAKETSERILEETVFGGEDKLVESFQKKGTDAKEGKKRKSDSKRPVWEDEDDQSGSVAVKRLGKYAREKIGDGEISTDQYGKLLQTKHQKVHSTPNWARLASEGSEQSEEDSDVEDLLQSTGDYITASRSLPKGVIQMKQCTDGNKDSPTTCKLTSVEFHPTAQVMLVAGMNQTLNLFQVDGKNNPKIQSIFMERFPIYTAHFSANGEEVILGSFHKGFHYYDMMAGKMVNVPPIKGLEEIDMKRFVVSPDGRFLAFLGSYGNIHMLSARSKEWIFSLKMNGSVESVCFTQDGNTMYSHGDDGNVYVWDMSTRDCIHHFIDDGCIRGLSIAVSHDNNFLACGSDSGVVNLYEPSVCLKSRSPKPQKALLNLTTPCKKLVFNSTSEILAMASDNAEKAVKLVHVPSQTVYSNFPDPLDTKLRIPACIDFSRNSGYFTIGTHKGQALLYRVKHYTNY